ncbi:YdjY domain-containing protein [Anatilimnocola floriformis]|uniref:YdjY domain-containing protein n=1 Tax=Anatilimnocola floriformis TaxID=2948575 RepID=UPI0020C4F5AC|nr:YdjY domain-containing protein [Anatilimnocola floriformis]
MQRLMTGSGWVAMILFCVACSIAQEKAEDKPAEKPAKAPEGLVRLSQKHDVWIDTKRKAVVVDGKICLREGQLEMFACPKGTKEHESIVALNVLPEQVHAGLLAVGAKKGTPVSFDPQYKAATGDAIEIFVLWKDADGKSHEVRAQEMIKNVKTGKAMDFDWVFAGSGFFKDEQTGREHYQANGGDFICVSNFPSATLDLPVPSTDANGGLLFNAFTENIPPKGTEVRVILVPRVKKGAGKAEEPKK